MPNLNLNLTPDQATALYLALDNTIYFGTDFKDRFTKQQREDVLDIFKLKLRSVMTYTLFVFLGAIERPRDRFPLCLVHAGLHLVFSI